MKKLISKIAIICSSLMMIVSCATLQEVKVDLNNEEQDLHITFTEKNFAQLDAKLIQDKTLQTSPDFIKECTSLIAALEKSIAEKATSKASRARFLAVTGKTYLLLNNPVLAKNYYLQSIEESKGNIQAAILAFRLDSTNSLDSYIAAPEEKPLIDLEKALWHYQNKEYVQAVANFDSAFISLPQYYKEFYTEIRNSAWELRSISAQNQTTKKAQSTADLLTQKQITVSQMLTITANQTNYLSKIFTIKKDSPSQLYKNAKSNGLLSAISNTENQNDANILQENQIVSKTVCARFLWNLYSNIKNLKNKTKYSKVYGPKNFTPIPDVLPSSPDFDACLGVIENEIMQLEDGTYFFGSTPVSAIEFNSYLQNLE
ncbi:MAG: hypothetical protein J6C25_11000 [Treponema sp.]|nr:hypothetical protein [Treponema sp.]